MINSLSLHLLGAAMVLVGGYGVIEHPDEPVVELVAIGVMGLGLLFIVGGLVASALRGVGEMR